MRFLKRVVLFTASAILLVAILLSAAYFALFFYSRANIDKEADERLFSSAGEDNVSRIFVNSAPLFSGEYIPEELELYGKGDRKATVKLSEVSDYVKLGFIATEDREFFRHNGVNIRRTIGAFLNSIFKFEKRFGASTITQQVVKNISGDNEITFKRKLNEIIRATLIEKNHSKEEILELYINIVPLSERCAGIKMGSIVYFDKEPKDLTLSEAALLVGITNAPSRLNPFVDKNAAKQRRNTVLYNMYDCGFITREQYNSACAEDIVLNEREKSDDRIDSWFYETLFEDIITDLKETYNISDSAARLYFNSGGFSIYTTMNKDIQKILDDVATDIIIFPEFSETDLNVAIVAIDNQTGDILGVIGQGGKKEGNMILNYTNVNIPPASTIKPLSIYAPLLEKGVINYSTPIDDSPLDIKNGSPYPKNSPNQYDGIITINEAIKKSKNTVSVRLFEKINKSEVISFLKNDIGFASINESEDKNRSALALGQLYNGVSLRELTNAYRIFPNDGIFDNEKSYICVVDSKNNTVLENKPQIKRVLSKSTARIMNQLLQEVAKDGTARSLTIKNSLDVAGKTGTSSGVRDRLFICYTPYVTIGVWVGYGDGARACPTDRQYHLEVFDACAGRIHEEILAKENIKEFSTEELIKLPFCLDSGMLIKEECLIDKRGERVGYGFYTEDNMPLNECKRHIGGVGIEHSYLTPIERKYKDEVYIDDEKYFLSYSSV